MKKEQTTLDDYRRIGRELMKLHLDTMQLGNEISGRFGKTKFNLFSSNKEMSKLRSDIEEMMFAERPDGFEELGRNERMNIFYGNGENQP